MTGALIPANMERFLAVTAEREQVVSANMANAATPGYSREVVNFSSSAAAASGDVLLGTGVSVDSIASVRDQLLDLNVQQQTAQQASATTQSTVLTTVEGYFSDATTSVGVNSALSAFFTSLSALSGSPSNAAARQTVIANAQDLVGQFQSTSAGLGSIQAGLNTQVAGDVDQINNLSGQIATLNVQVAQQTALGQGGGIALDQRTELERQLSALAGISITQTAEGDTVTTGNGTALVVGGRSSALSTTAGANGLTQVLDVNSANITSAISGGDLGGLLQVRDTTIPGFQSQLDTLAHGFATAFNAAQSSGYDLAGNAGGALFTIPATVAGSASAIALRTTNGSALAVSSDGSAGSNGNLVNLTNVQSQPLASGLSTTDTLAELVDSVGTAASDAGTQSTALQASLTQLTNQQGAVSGVSIDEESSNLIRFQQAYQAAAEVVTTIQTLFASTLNMVSGSGA